MYFGEQNVQINIEECIFDKNQNDFNVLDTFETRPVKFFYFIFVNILIFTIFKKPGGDLFFETANRFIEIIKSSFSNSFSFVINLESFSSLEKSIFCFRMDQSYMLKGRTCL